ncbi:MAG: acyl-CoA dehydrogenase family protein, partial [Ginsengibacter sp.]
MDFLQNELTTQVAETVKQFAEQYIRPHVMEWDENQVFPAF